jgi:putative transposase
VGTMPWKDSSVFRQRCKLVGAMMAGVEPVTVICRRWGVSRTIAYRVLARFRADGRRGLRDRSHVPKRAFARQAPRWRKPVLELRRVYPSWGARKLRWWLRQHFPRQRGPAKRTVQRWLKQGGCVRQHVHAAGNCALAAGCLPPLRVVPTMLGRSI